MENQKKFQPGNVLTISIAHLVHDIYSSFLAPILPLLIEKLSLNLKYAGFLAVIQRLPSSLNPFIGIIADKIRMRYLIIITPSITTVTMSLLGIAPHYTILVVLSFVMGLSSAFFHVPAPVMIKRVAGNRTGKGMSFFMLGGEIARTIGPLIIIGAVSLWGLEGTYRLIPFGVLASFLLYLRIGKINISMDFEKQKKVIGLRQTFIPLLPVFFTIAGFTFFRAYMKSALTIFLPTYLIAKGETLWMAGIFLAILQAAGALGTVISGTISDRIGRKNTLIIVSVVSPFLMWLFISLEGIFVIPILILMGFFLISSQPVLMAFVQDIDSEHPAFLNGIYMSINFLINSLALIVTGALADWIGLEITYKIAAILSLFAIPFALRIKIKKIGGI